MRRLRQLLFVLLASCSACEDEPAASTPSTASAEADQPGESHDATSSANGDRADATPPTEPRRLPVIEVDDPDAKRPKGARELSHAAAFDLIGTPPGATLLWADDETVHAARLSDRGEPLRRAQVAKVRGVAELAAAATPDRLAAIWIAGDASLGTANAPLGTMAFEPPRPVGATEPFEPADRGRLHASATADGRLMALARTADEPCQRYDEPSCANFTMLDLRRARARRRPGLEVPHPCPRPVAGFAVAGLHWHYAVCHREGPAPTTVLFTAQETPSYAQTNELLTGCSPRGMTRRGDDIWLTGICGGDQRTVHVRKLNVTPGATSPSDDVRCDGDALVVTLDGEDATLGADTVGIGAILPRHVVPAGARAVWTGRALLVAQPGGETLALARHECRAGSLHRAE